MATSRQPSAEKPLSFLAWKLLQAMAKPYGHPPHEYPGSYPALTANRDGGKFVRLSSRHGDLNATVTKAAKELIDREWIVVDSYKSHRLNEAGLAAAESLPRPDWAPPAPPAMNEAAWEVLGSLKYVNIDASYKQPWARSLDVGGGNGSNHSTLLMVLVRHGYAESQQRGSGKVETAETVVPEPILGTRAKGSRLYRIAPKGVEALAIRRTEKELKTELDAAMVVTGKVKRPKP